MDLVAGEISGIICLVREVCDLWDDPAAWRAHLLKGTCALVGGNVGTMFSVQIASDAGRVGKIHPVAIFGMPAAEQESLVHRSTAIVSNSTLDDVSHFLPGQEKFWAEFGKQGWVTATRDELTDLATYRASAGYQDMRRHADCDDYVWSMRYVDVPQRIEMFGLDRPHGAAPFGRREVTLIKLLHDEIAPLIGVRLATEEHLCRDGLSRRLRQTLSLLLQGKSEKEVAHTLQLHPRTVHDYVTAIYRHFRVSSRAELLAYFIHRSPKLRFGRQPEVV